MLSRQLSVSQPTSPPTRFPWEPSPPSRRRIMSTKRFVLPLVIGCALLVGCSSNTRTIRVAVPPRVDLQHYPSVGLVTFSSSNADANLERLSTQRFLQAVQAAQPGTRVVELGREADVLGSVHRSGWDAQALRAVKESRGVD